MTRRDVTTVRFLFGDNGGLNIRNPDRRGGLRGTKAQLRKEEEKGSKTKTKATAREKEEDHQHQQHHSRCIQFKELSGREEDYIRL